MAKQWQELFFAGVILLFSVNTYAADITADSRISEVTIYQDSALINRTANLKVVSGEQKIIFADIIPEIDEHSLRVSAKGDAEFKLLGAQVKRQYQEDAPSEKIKGLQEQIQKIEDEIKRAQDLKTVFSEEKDFLDSIRLFSNGQIPKDLITKMPQAADLDNILKFLDAKLKENYSGVMESELKVREWTNKLSVLRQELAQISTPQKKLTRSIIVEAEILKAGGLELTVSYLASGASWQPIYDARASFEKNQVELVSYGIVRQTTGEDWQDVDISLSTARPAIGGNLPYVSPWFLRPYQPQRARYGEMRNSLSVFKEKSEMESQTEAFVKKDLDKINAPALETYATAQERGIAVVYKLPHTSTVKSDGSDHKLPVSAQVLKVDFEYSTYPRLIQSAYLGSRVANAKELQLLAGRVNIFLEGDFVGDSNIDNIAPGEEFDLYLGADENIKVKRQLIEKKVDDVLLAGIPSPTRKSTFKYKTAIENYKNKKIKLIFFEAMPVSEDEKIKIKVTDVSLQPKEKDWKDRKGIWRWELELEPKAKQEISYTFVIEHPRDMQVEGL